MATLCAVVAALAAGPAPAWAHGGGTPIPDAAFYRTDITEVAHQPAGVSVRVDPAGEFLELTNAGTATVIVYGYLGEPYLRVTATGVEENQVSPSTYLNRSLFADSVPTGGQAADVAPAWHQTASVGRTQWHDHRIHWMGQARPPAVNADPTRPHQVGTWVVHAAADGVAFDIHGTLRWIGKPGSKLPIATWELVVANTLILTIAIVVFWRRSKRRRKATPADQPDAKPAAQWLVSTDGKR
ncbi:MAG: hypothetical protein AUI14_06800 [Actinobacteria bacterium 13_2_20CM_2_71_6]|nr:MAG: hypothetical protein AUI14_06800 [Actinobacteria bacterium 13_2_20CM_2_71_6]